MCPLVSPSVQNRRARRPRGAAPTNGIGVRQHKAPDAESASGALCIRRDSPIIAPRGARLLCGIGRLPGQLLRKLSPFTPAHAGEHLFYKIRQISCRIRLLPKEVRKAQKKPAASAVRTGYCTDRNIPEDDRSRSRNSSYRNAKKNRNARNSDARKNGNCTDN